MTGETTTVPAGRDVAGRGPYSHRTWVMVIGALLAVATVALVWLSVVARQPGNGIIAIIIGVPSAGVGLVVARRLPANPIGWIFLVIAACLILSSVSGDYAFLIYRLGHHLPLGVLALALYELWGPGLLLLGVVILLFPNGRLPTRRWRWILRSYLVIYAGYVAALTVATGTALAGRPLVVDGSGGLAATDNATGWFGVIQSATLLPAMVLWVAAVARQVLAWRRSAGDARQQLKWLASGAGLAIAGAVLATIGFGLGWFGFAALPLSIGVGILRYRLYDIDRIISRTLAYALVTGLLVGVYAGLVLLATRVLPVSGPVAVAGATLAVAALFNPLRRWVQRIVDRRFNRARYDADRMVTAFAARLQDATDLEGVRGDLLGTVRQALAPAHASVWLGGGQP